MSQRSRTETGSSRAMMEGDNQREYENNNPHPDSSGMDFFCSSEASDIFRDHGHEDSLHVPQEQLKRLSFHDLEQADPSDVPLPLNIRKTLTPSNTTQKQEYNSVKDNRNLASEHPYINDRFETYQGSSEYASQKSQRLAGRTHPSPSEQSPSHIPDPLASVSTERQPRSRDEYPRPPAGLPTLAGDVFSTSQIRNVRREETQGFHESPETNQSPPLRDNTAKSLPRQQPIPVPGDPDIPHSESVASFDTVAQEHYRYILARRAMLGLLRPRACKVDSENNENEPVRGADPGEHMDERVRGHNESGYVGKLRDQYGLIIPEAEELTQPERPPSSIDSQGMTREEAIFARYVLLLRPPSSNFSFNMLDNPGPATSSRRRHISLDTNELDVEPCNDIVDAYRRRRERREAELYGSGDDEYDGRDSDGPGERVTRPEADMYAGTARLRPNLQPSTPTRIPRPVQRAAHSSSLHNERDVSQDEDVELEVIGEDVDVGEDVPELSKAKENGAKGEAPAKKPEGAEQYDADPWALMVMGTSTPRRAQKKNKKKSETESESHSSKFTPSSTHSKSSKHSDQPSSSSDKPGKRAKRGLAKPSPIQSVFRVASGILPKFLHSPSARSQLSASESHKDSNANPNRDSDNNTREQHRITTASSSSSGTRPSTLLSSTTATSPTPFRACSRPELGFPSSPRYNNRGPQSSFFSSLPRSSPGYHTMGPPTHPRPLIPQFRSTDVGAQTTSNEVEITGHTPQSSIAAQFDVEETANPEDDPMVTYEPSVAVPQASPAQYTLSDVATEDMTAEASANEVATTDDVPQQAAASQLDTEDTAAPGACPCVNREGSAFVPRAPCTQSTTGEASTEDVNQAFVHEIATERISTTRAAPTEMTRTVVAPQTEITQLDTDGNSSESFPQVTSAEDFAPVASQAHVDSTLSECNAIEPAPVEVAATHITTRSSSSNESTYADDDDDWTTINSDDTEEEGSSSSESTGSGHSSDEGEDEDSGSDSSPSGSGGVAPGDGEGDGEDEEASSGAVGSTFEALEDGEDVPPGPERAESGKKVDDSESQLPQAAQDLYEAIDDVSLVNRLESYRKELGCEHVEWTPKQKLPMRPGDERVWYSNNLRCEDCAPNCCVCGRPCCMWNAAEQVLGNDLALDKEKQRALKLLQRLQRLLPVGVEPRTHVLCSSPGGCGLYACPYCAGRCPMTMCRDIQCLNCKEDPWGPCDWHPLD